MRRIFLAATFLAVVVCSVSSSANAQLIQSVASGLSNPFGVAVDPSGNLYIADTYAERILVLNNQTVAITVANVTVNPGQLGTIAGNGTAGYSGDGGAAINAEVYNPVGVAADKFGNIYIADLYNYRVRKVNSSGVISTVTGNGTQTYGGDNGPAAAANLYPYAVAVDGAGNLFISDTYNQRIRAINMQTSPIALSGVTIQPGNIATIAGNGQVGSVTNGPALNAEFSDPYGVAADANGNVFICDTYNREMYAVNTGTNTITLAGIAIPAGNIAIIAGNGGYGFRGDGDLATTAEFSDPDGIGVDAADNVYVSDTENQRVRKITNATGIISTIAGTGDYGYNGDNIPAISAMLSYPRTIAIDTRGNVYFADEPNLRIREIVVNPGTPVITSRPSTAFTAGVFGSFQVTTTDAPIPALTYAGSLPSGIQFLDNGNGTGTLSGTPSSTMGSPVSITITATNTVGTVSQNFTLVIYAPGGAPTASFVGTDTNTEGAWQGKYGSDGYSLASVSPQKIPSYAAFSIQNEIGYTWDTAPKSPSALQVPGGTAIAATWYTNSSYYFDINFTDGNSHLFALYALDYDQLGRSEMFQVEDANTGLILDTESISNFGSGIYLSWQISGHVQIVVTPTGAGNAVVSGAFFGGAGSSASPTLLISKTHTGVFTQGQQNRTYSVSVSNAAYGTPTSGTVTVTETIPSGLTLVSMAGSQWSCSGASCSRSDSLMAGASYSPITVTVNVAPNATSPQINQVSVSGGGAAGAIATDTTQIAGTGVASFFGSDITTQGNWINKYGSDGYSLAKSIQSLPVYDSTFNAQQVPSWPWATTTTDPRALETDTNGDRTAATWYGTGPFSFDLNISDALTHQIAIYAIDWDGRGRSETVQIVDGSSGAILDTRIIPDPSTSTTATNFLNGVYLVWNVSGHVAITVTPDGGPNAVVSGIFWGGGPESIVATSGTPQTAFTGSTFSSLTATVSSGGVPVSGLNVVFAAPVTGPSGTFTGGMTTATVSTNPQGVATAPTFTANSTLGGPYMVTATAAGIATPASFSLTNSIHVGPPATIVATAGASQSARINAAFTSQLQATVYDASNNPVPTVTITFAAPTSGASGTFAGGSTTAQAATNSQGVATSPIFTANGTAGGPYNVVASVLGATSANFSLTNTAPQTGPCSGNCANFLDSDATTQGAWPAHYGIDGYSLANSAQLLPSYAVFTPQNQASYTWAGSTTDPRALQVPGAAAGIAAAWYNPAFSYDLNVGSSSHQVSLYLLDWDYQGRAETIQILDGDTGSPLDSENISNFGTGTYLVWNVSGHVKIVVSSTAGPNGVVSGVFFGAGLPPASVSFVSQDTSTQGAWQSKYGADGYSIANSVQNLPGYASFAVQNDQSFTWNASTSDPRALQIPGGASGIASSWYGGNFTFNVNVGTSPHQVALYLLDWDNAGRAENVQIFDANSTSTTPLNTETVSNFGSGLYLVWNITGHVRIVVTGTGGPNAVVSGVFFGGAPTPATVNSFTRDISTEGSWEGLYGTAGYSLANSAQSLPSYASFVVEGPGNFTWNPSTTDPRALQAPGGTSRIAATWYGGTFTFDVNVGTSPHSVALYALDWDSQGRAEKVQIFDATSSSSTPLDTETVSAFTNGAYLIWSVTGHVRIVVIATGGPNAVVSGVFFQ
jgi:hypothetical protein